MATGIVHLPAKDSAGAPHEMPFLSDDGTADGNVAPAKAVLRASDFAPIDPATTADVEAVRTVLNSLDGKAPALVTGCVPVFAKGSAGIDLSLYAGAAPAWPHLGQAIVGGAFDTWVYLGTVPADAARADIEVHNYAGQAVLLLVDDGTAAAGNSPVNVTPFVLPFGIAGGAPVDPWRSAACRGRLQFYAPQALAGTAYIGIRKH